MRLITTLHLICLCSVFHGIRSTFDVRNFECEFVTNLPRELEKRIAVAVETSGQQREMHATRVFSVRLDVRKECQNGSRAFASLSASPPVIFVRERVVRLVLRERPRLDSTNESTLLATVSANGSTKDTIEFSMVSQTSPRNLNTCVGFYSCDIDSFFYIFTRDSQVLKRSFN